MKRWPDHKFWIGTLQNVQYEISSFWMAVWQFWGYCIWNWMKNWSLLQVSRCGTEVRTSNTSNWRLMMIVISSGYDILETEDMSSVLQKSLVDLSVIWCPICPSSARSRDGASTCCMVGFLCVEIIARELSVKIVPGATTTLFKPGNGSGPLFSFQVVCRNPVCSMHTGDTNWKTLGFLFLLYLSNRYRLILAVYTQFRNLTNISTLDGLALYA